MPIYEYRCDQGHVFEVRARMADDPVTSCLTCEASVQRVFHPIAVHFKGSGFYNTDYGKRKRGSSEEGSDGDGNAGSGDDAKKAGDGSSSGEAKGSSSESKGSAGGSKDSSDKGKGSGGESKGSSDSGSKATSGS
ncbi:MAG: zinc ribbon domain-containing protein [Actinomycetota bacterium]|nr:zinc ribbon domain-containing protein [Actinomycetota bacterium]